LNGKLICRAVRCVLFFALFSMVTFLLVSNNTEFKVHATSTAVYVNPSKVSFDLSNGTIGTLFNITVRVSNMEDMKAWQVKMYFNDTIINATAWWEPTWDTSYVFYGKATYAAPTPPDIGKTYVQIIPGNASIGFGSVLATAPSPGGGFTGNGLLCILTFNITANPPSGQTYSCKVDIVADSKYSYWLKAGETAKRAFDTYTDGEYEIIPEFHWLVAFLLLVTATISVVLAKKTIGKPKLHMKQ